MEGNKIKLLTCTYSAPKLVRRDKRMIIPITKHSTCRILWNVCWCWTCSVEAAVCCCVADCCWFWCWLLERTLKTSCMLFTSTVCADGDATLLSWSVVEVEVDEDEEACGCVVAAMFLLRLAAWSVDVMSESRSWAPPTHSVTALCVCPAGCGCGSLLSFVTPSPLSLLTFPVSWLTLSTAFTLTPFATSTM